MNCKKCGTENPEENQFCSKCGKKLTTKNQKNLKNKKIILLISIILILIIGIVSAMFINKSQESNDFNKSLIMEEQEKGAEALKCLYEGNYVSDISQINVYSLYYSNELNLVFIGSKINGKITNCLYNCNNSTFIYEYANVMNEYPSLLNEENAFSKIEIQFILDYAQSKTDSDSFYKLITDSISYNMENLKEVYNEVNDLFSKYYQNKILLSEHLDKYYKNTLLASNYTEAISNHKRIEKQLDYIEDKKNISELLELYAVYNEFYNSVMSYPTGYSYATYLSSMKEKYNDCYKELSKVQQLYK